MTRSYAKDVVHNFLSVCWESPSINVTDLLLVRWLWISDIKSTHLIGLIYIAYGHVTTLQKQHVITLQQSVNKDLM